MFQGHSGDRNLVNDSEVDSTTIQINSHDELNGVPENIPLSIISNAPYISQNCLSSHIKIPRNSSIPVTSSLNNLARVHLNQSFASAMPPQGPLHKSFRRGGMRRVQMIHETDFPDLSSILSIGKEEFGEALMRNE